MRCSYCGDEKSRVVDSRLGRDRTEVRRRRACAECGRRFTTRERVDEVLLKIVKRDQRRANHDKVTAPNVVPCPKCGDMMLTHRICPACGHYKGKQIIAGKQEAEA